MTYNFNNINYYYKPLEENAINFVFKNGGNMISEVQADFRETMYNYLGIQDTSYFWKFANFCDTKTTVVVLSEVQSYSRTNNVVTVVFKDASSLDITLQNNDYAQISLEYLDDLVHNYKTIVNADSQYGTIIDVDDSITLSALNTEIQNASSGNLIRFATGNYSFASTIVLKAGVDLLTPLGANITCNTATGPSIRHLQPGKVRIMGLADWDITTAISSDGMLHVVQSPFSLSKSEVFLSFRNMTQHGDGWTFYCGGTSNTRGAFRIKGKLCNAARVVSDSDSEIDYQDVDIRKIITPGLFNPDVYQLSTGITNYQSYRMLYVEQSSASYWQGATEYCRWHFTGLYKCATSFADWATAAPLSTTFTNCILESDDPFVSSVYDDPTFTIEGEVHMNQQMSAGIVVDNNGVFVEESVLAVIDGNDINSTLLEDNPREMSPPTVQTIAITEVESTNAFCQAQVINNGNQTKQVGLVDFNSNVSL